MGRKMLKGNMFVLGGLIVGGYCLYQSLHNKQPIKYSLEWIRGLTDEEWKFEREIVQQKFRSPKYDDTVRTNFKRILDF